MKLEKTIGEIVADDYRAAKVFESHGIDFCCKGGRTLDDVCESKNLVKAEILEQIDEVVKSDASQFDKINDWPLDQLIDHIETKHHRYVEEHIPVIGTYLKKLKLVHGNNHPELNQVYDLFINSSHDLVVHMKKEELVLFPFVKKMCRIKETDEVYQTPQFNSVVNPISSMIHDHNIEGERFEKISKLTKNYETPKDGCNTYHVAMNMLRDFENDLHTHIHLENNILFPKAQALEKELQG